MHVTLSQLKAYHAKLKLVVGHCELTIIFPELRKPLRWTVLCVQDHLDPFWWSQHPLGGCEDGATAPNMSASAWHFAGRQIGKGHSVAGTLASFLPVQRQVVLAGELGLEMQLIVKWINGADNVYTPEFAFDQNQVLPPTASAQTLPTSSLPLASQGSFLAAGRGQGLAALLQKALLLPLQCLQPPQSCLGWA